MTLDQAARLIREGLPLALVLAVGILLWEGAKRWLPLFVEKAAGLLAGILVGSRIVRRQALRLYREQVAASSSKLPVIFGETELDVSTVYVPLEVEGHGEARDAHLLLREADRAVVVGPPGAGKSMLLKHFMLTWATGRGTRRLPVLLELHRCAGTEVPLEQLLVEQLARDGFPRATAFVSRELRTGGLTVLFDGLDEVNAENRSRVTLAIRDFMQAYVGCQVIVTCRGALYDRQLAPEATTIFRVLEFDERLIRQFLVQWPEPVKVNALMNALRSNPRIMQLARNPLLLTMIAYLQGEGTTLPDSRAKFYQKVTQELLDRLKRPSNQFDGQAKLAVLRRLALVAQDVPAREADRRTLSYKQTINEIKDLLPDFPPNADAGAVLRDIVDRSGLLLAVDGGECYQFAHLSLQEYLAAEALEDDPTGLLDRYCLAPDDWGEAVKLWCGIVRHDCGPVIEAVFKISPVLAFECLADAHTVDEEVAEEITAHFQEQLADAGPEVVAAFGVVAADQRERGKRLFRFLADEARGNDMACAALAATKLPKAAGVLAKVGALHHLVDMGELAVPALTAASRKGNTDAVDLLAGVGTPAAARALGTLIWSDGPAAKAAAWHLSCFLADPAMDEVLNDVRPTAGKLGIDWIWDPFRDPDLPELPAVAARIAHLLHKQFSLTDVHLIDVRLRFPLSLLVIDGIVEKYCRKNKNLSPKDAVVRKYLNDPALCSTERSLRDSLSPSTQVWLFRHFLEFAPFNRRVWAAVRENVSHFAVDTSCAYRLTLTAVAVFCGLAVYSGVAVGVAGFPAGHGWISLLFAVFTGGTSLYLLRHLHENSTLFVQLLARPTRVLRESGFRLSSLLAACWSRTTVVFAVVVGTVHVGLSITAVVVLATLCVVLTFLLYWYRHYHLVNNPYRRLFEHERQVGKRRTSIVASGPSSPVR